MIRRRRALLWSAGLILAVAVVLLLGVAVGVETEWGRERVRRIVVSKVQGLLDGRGQLYLGRVEGGFGGHFVVDSVAILDDRGRVLAAAGRIEADMPVGGLLTGNLRFTRFVAVRPYLMLAQESTGWNVGRLFAKKKSSVLPTRSTWAISVDSAEFRDGHVVLLTPDSLPTLPPHRREFSHLQLAIGHTQVLHPGRTGGSTPVGRISADISDPPLQLRDAAGTVGWSSDSLLLDFPRLRLPASKGAIRGTIAWALPGPARLDLRLRADSVSLAEVAWISSIIPPRGEGSADVRIRNGANPHDMGYELSNLDVRETKSRITGAFTVTAGREVSITNLALALQPLDLDLVREIFGASTPNKAWQGSLTGTARGRGGSIHALHLDEVRVAYTDRRAHGAVSHLLLAGDVDLEKSGTVLRGMLTQLQDLDIRTLGAVSRTADSLHGVLTGRLTLDGPLHDVRFHSLSLAHVDGNLPRSYVSGEGRLASDQRTRWLDAKISLDTVAVATVLRGRTTTPLQGAVRGRLELHATRDTMTIDTDLRVGDGSLHFLGATLLDSTRTWWRGNATFLHLDPRLIVARRDIPVLRLDGTAELEIDGTARRSEGHVNLALDTTSRIGDSPVTVAHVRAGVDSTGFHVDTAEIHALAWRLSASGRIAKTGVTHDTLRFSVEFDSLAPLRALLLDSTGRALADSVHGALFVHAGTLAGSLDSLALTADFGLADARWNGITVRRMIGHAALERLPQRATGTVTANADSIAAGGFTASRLQLRADVRDGRQGLVTANIISGDTLSTRLVANLQRDGDTTHIVLDSLGVLLGAGRWRLDHPARVLVSPRGVRIDSTLIRSGRGATIALRASIPAEGPVDGTFAVDGLRPEELAFTGVVPPDVTGLMRGQFVLSGTRDDPRFVFGMNLDSIRVAERAAPSLAVTGTYAHRRAQLDARGSAARREILSVKADLPIDLTLRPVRERMLDDSLTVRIRADSATLLGLEALVPHVEGLAGTLSADLLVRGTRKQVTGEGTLRIRDGAFELPRYGTTGRNVVMDDTLSGDSVRIHLRMSDGEGPRNTLSANGAFWLAGGTWQANVTSTGRGFRVMDDPLLAHVDASWLVHLTGALKQPTLEGDVALPTAFFVLGQQRQVRPLLRDSLSVTERSLRAANISSLRVVLGNDVRLRSRDANVKLAGDVEINGPVVNPYVSGEIFADRGTYRVNLGVLKRTFRVDSGTVRLAGDLKEKPASLDIWTSYRVRRPDLDDVSIVAHLTGTPDAPRLELSSPDLGSAVAQSEIISYLIFGAPSFALDGRPGRSTVGTATAALVPSIGGVLEGFLGTLLPFFNSLQVATIAGSGPQNLTVNPLDGLLNSFALIAGRQVGADGFLNLSGGVCRGSQLASAQSPPSWAGISAEYRPKYRLSAVASFDPGSSPCNGLGRYQFGLDLFREFKF